MAANFRAFFNELNGYDPFPWQQRLADEVVATGRWPNVLALPTASGKTAVMDVAVFALATAAGRHPRRIVFVVDRRIVVDEAYERARRIARTLRGASTGALGLVAQRLRAVAGTDEPLATSILRGGMYRDDRWARSPAQPTIVVSTVDQVGSRLLFRGYGVSPFGWPLHAGLLGNDTLVVLDEAHCSRPFAQTLEGIARYRGADWAERPPTAPFHVVTMTATPPSEDSVFRLEAADRQHEVLGRRLTASKRATLVCVAREGDAPFIKELVRHAVTLAVEPRAVGVVVNRVNTARSLFEALRERSVAGSLDADVVLLTGRVRPAERDALLRRVSPRVKADSNRSPCVRSLIVVATQCIEVGADLDFDALVTECAPLDALRQRFGRLDRLGRHGTTQAVIIGRPEHEGPDPVYGSALGETWRWLQAVAGEAAIIDFGVGSLDALLDGGEEPRGKLVVRLGTPSEVAPVMLPAHCDLWAQTSPPPHVSPDPAVYLHGLGRTDADVHVVWRGDLDGTDPSRWAEVVGICPPTSGEAVPIPIYAVRAWLAQSAVAAVADVEGGAHHDDDEETQAGGHRVLRWCGPESARTELVDGASLRPGDTVVVPAITGGCDEFGWNPQSQLPVPDLGDELQAARRRAVLRLHPGATAGWASCAQAVAHLAHCGDRDELDDGDVRAALLVLAAEQEAPPWLRRVAAHLASGCRVTAHPSGTGLIVSTTRLLPRDDEEVDFTDEDDTASAGGRAVPLQEHLESVAARVGTFCEALGLDAALAEDLGRAARAHDLGKADRRFQVWLHGGDRLTAAAAEELLAKSGSAPRDLAAVRAARRASGYPEGARHELASVRLLEVAPAGLRCAHDPELVLHLIGSHHGRCRPFAPVVVDAAPIDVCVQADGATVKTSSATSLERVDSGVPQRFWNLARRYGWWGLAWLEAIVRLADHRVSEEEQEARP